MYLRIPLYYSKITFFLAFIQEEGLVIEKIIKNISVDG
jgi:hypothetical protein